MSIQKNLLIQQSADNKIQRQNTDPTLTAYIRHESGGL